MKSYEIWLKGGGSITGTMTEKDSIELHRSIKNHRELFHFHDGDGDDVSVVIEQIACFACRDEENSIKVGF